MKKAFKVVKAFYMLKSVKSIEKGFYNNKGYL